MTLYPSPTPFFFVEIKRCFWDGVVVEAIFLRLLCSADLETACAHERVYTMCGGEFWVCSGDGLLFRPHAQGTQNVRHLPKGGGSCSQYSTKKCRNQVQAAGKTSRIRALCGSGLRNQRRSTEQYFFPPAPSEQLITNF